MSDFIASLTTTSPRFGSALHVVSDISLNQTMRPSNIFIHVPEGQKVLIETMLNNKKFTSIRSQDIIIKEIIDVGPASKLAYSLESDIPVITIDDDVNYDPLLFERLIRASKIWPGSIISDRVHRITLDEDGNIKPYLNWIREEEMNTEPSFRLFPTGVGGVLYPPKSLHQDASSAKLIQKLAPKTDDVWWWFQSLRAYTRIASPEGSRLLTYKRNTQESGLWQTGNKIENDKSINRIISHYAMPKNFLSNEHYN